MNSRIFHILIADDDADDQSLLADAIKSYTNEQISITIVADGAELIRYLEDCEGHASGAGQMPDVILLDINMPLINGFEALKLIKTSANWRQILVYIVTTMRNIDKLEECLDEGASNFFTKPNQMKGYYSIIQEVMRNLNIPESRATGAFVASTAGVLAENV